MNRENFKYHSFDTSLCFPRAWGNRDRADHEKPRILHWLEITRLVMGAQAAWRVIVVARLYDDIRSFDS